MSAQRPHRPFEPPSFRGYHSMEHKRRFTMWAGLLGAGFFLAQIFLPMLLMLPMFFSMAGEMEAMRRPAASTAVYWEGALWHLERPLSSPGGASKLVRFELHDEADPETMAEFHGGKAWLLPDEGRLWLISSSMVGVYERGGVQRYDNAGVLGAVTRPFFIGGNPAVIEGTPLGNRLRIFQHGGWQDAGLLEWLAEQDSEYCEQAVRILNDGELHHLFWLYGETLYYSPGPLENPGDSWTPVASLDFCDWWSVAMVGGQVHLAFEEAAGNGKVAVAVMALQDNDWRRLVTVRKGLVSDLGLTPAGGEGRYAVVLTSGFDSLLAIICQGAAELDEIRPDAGFLPHAMEPMMPFMIVPYAFNLIAPLLLALILTFMMPRYRVSDFDVGEFAVPYASLFKRGLAVLIDSALIMAALGVWIYFMLGNVLNFELFLEDQGVEGFFTMLKAILGGFAVSTIAFAAIAIVEGKTGGTPGKWLLGIRVLHAETLEPCGIGRGLIRNLLRFVDAFFNYMVAILIVAFTEKWQRLGDLAANTVVLDIRKPPSEPFAFADEEQEVERDGFW